METKLRTKCSYSYHICKRSRYRDYKYCLQHILEDQLAPFTKCQHISKVTRRRCLNAASKPDRNSSANLALCENHKHMKSQSNKRKIKHHKNFLSKVSGVHLNTQNAINHLQNCIQQNPETITDTDSGEGEFASQENERWRVNQSSSWKAGEPDVDLQQLDENENALLHTGIFTQEEIVSLSRDNLVRLQAMYIDQFKQLHQELFMNRLQYLSDSNQASSSNTSEEIRAMLNFRQSIGPEALLSRQRKEKRQEESTFDPLLTRQDHQSAKSRCCQVTNHIRCRLSCLPYTKFCVLHILHDPLQVLYKPCSQNGCKTPVCLLNNSVLWQSSSTPNTRFCILHAPLAEVEQDLDTKTDQLQNVLERQHDIVKPKASFEVVSKVLDSPGQKSYDCNFTLPTAYKENVNNIADIGQKNVEDISSFVKEQIGDENETSENNIINQISNYEPSKICKLDSPVQIVSTTCALDDLQPGQCYVMNSCLDEEQKSLHLQELTGVYSTGKPKLGQCLVMKASTEQTMLGNDQIPNEGNQTALLEIDNQSLHKKSPMIAEVEHKGTFLSVSHQQSNPSESLNQLQKQTFIPPVEKNTELANMPPLAPVGKEIVEDFSGEKGTSSTKPFYAEKTSDENPIKSVISSSDSDRKPTCPDEETAIASLLSLCTATSHSKLPAMFN